MEGRGKMGRRWLKVGAAALVACAVLTTPVLGPQAGGSQEKSGGERAGSARPIDLVVDGTLKRTWTPEELQGLATAKWENRTGTPHPAIPLSTLLKEGGMPRDAVTELRVSSGGRTVTLKGAELAKIDQLVLRTGRKSFNRPWRLVPLDPSIQPTRDAYTLPGVRRIEVITKGASD